MQLSFSIEGEKQLSRRLRIVSDRVKDWTPAFKETSVQLKQVFAEDAFKTEGQAVGQVWSPLSRAYAERKAKLYPGKGLLEATGAMRKAFKTLWKADMAAVWNESEYFKYHQSRQPRKRLPRRAMMALAEKQKQMVVKIFHTYFKRVTKP